MKKQENDKWLDELISQTINTSEPQFDVEKWRREYPEEFQVLKSRAEQKTSTIQAGFWEVVLHNRLVKLAAAVIIVAIGLLIVHRIPHRHEPAKVSKMPKSPAEMLTMASLNAAYRLGGMEGVEKQYEEALELLGPRPAKITVKELLAEFNGT